MVVITVAVAVVVFRLGRLVDHRRLGGHGYKPWVDLALLLPGHGDT